MDIMEAPEETLRNVNEGMKQVMNLVADELMFIFFPEEYANNNPDYWTFDDGSLLGGRSAGSSYYTRDETVSTMSNKGWKKVVGNRGPGKNEKRRERRDGSVASLTRASDKSRQAASDAEGYDFDVNDTNDDVLNLFAAETEDLESPPPPSEERREDASMTNSAKRDPEEGISIRQINSGTSGNAIDLCDAEEVDGVVVTHGQNEELASHLGESTLQRLQRLRAKREELRQERERYESGIPFNPEPQDYEAEDARPEPQGDYEVQEMQNKIDVLLARDQETDHMQSDAHMIDHHREQIQAKVQQLSKVLDQIMIKKLNGEFPDDPETRAMEAEIRANLLEFQRWWQPSESDENVRSAPHPDYQAQW